MTDPRPPTSAPSAAPIATATPATIAETTQLLITSRYSVAPKRLLAPGPSREELERMLEAAAAAPDHRELAPWRFVEIGEDRRAALADIFEDALIERDPDAADEDRGRAREKAFRAPLLLLAVARLLPPHPDVVDQERFISLGAALQNMLLVAHALGYGAMLTSGRALATARMREAFALAEGEVATCFVSIGTPKAAPRRRPRPRPDSLLTRWAG